MKRDRKDDSTRDLLMEFLGEWKQFMRRYEDSSREIKNMINKVNTNSKAIGTLDGWKGAHEKHHTWLYRIGTILLGGGILAKLIDWFTSLKRG